VGSALAWIIRRDLVLALRQRTDVMTTVVFFVIVVSLFPLGVGPEMEKLRPLAAGVLWVAALLASMLSLGRLFAADYADGSLEQLLIAPQPLSLLVLGKIVAHWLVSGLPLVLIAPVLGIQYDLTGPPLVVMTLSLFIGTPVLSAIGAVGAALTLGLRGGGVLIALLVLPLYVPVIVFGAGAVEATQAGIGPAAHLSLLAAFLMLSLVIGPLAAATALRISVE
jgi:heme exporter protein B